MAKIKSGEIGEVLAVCATNHGKCPGGWFTDKSKSGGGRQHLKSPWGHVKGQKTRKKRKASDKFIVQRRKKRRA